MTNELSYADIDAAAERIAGLVRPITLAPAEPAGQLWLALEFLQHTGSFKARGAANFVEAHHASGTLPAAGVTIASGGNAGLACAWAAARRNVPATVFLPATAPAVKIERLRSYGAQVRLESDYPAAFAAGQEFSAETGALMSHAYDHPLITAGAGTLLSEIHQALPGLDTIVVAAGGGGLFAGIATAAAKHGIRTVAVEPEHCRALNAALEAGHPVDVEIDSIAADALGGPRATDMALSAARLGDTVSVLVTDEQIVAARRALWDERRIAVEHAAATALSALRAGAYRPAAGEMVCVVLCGANTDPADLIP